MALDYEYGINIGNRFIDLVGHDEDPDVFIASKTQVDEKAKKSKEPKQSTSASKKKPNNKSATPATTTKTNKENITGKSTNNEQQTQNVVSDNNNQPARVIRGRGARGFSGRGGSAGHDRLTYDGSRRPPPPSDFKEGQKAPIETSDLQQNGDNWESQPTDSNFGRGRGRGRGRGYFMGDRGGGRGRGHFDGERGGGRGRGRGYFDGGRGLGYFEGGRGRGRGRGQRGNRNSQEDSHEQQENIQLDVDNTRVQSAPIAGQEFDKDAPTQETQFESNGMRRGRGYFRPRVFRNNRNYGGDRQNQYEGEEGQNNYRQNRRQQPDRQNPFEGEEGQNNYRQNRRQPDRQNQYEGEEGQNSYRQNRRQHDRQNQFEGEEGQNNYRQNRRQPDRQNQYEGEEGQINYRQNRRQHDRQPRSFVSGVKSFEKRDGAGAHNWGKATSNPDENPVTEETLEGPVETETNAAPTTTPKAWSEQVDEAEKQLTLDEYKKQLEAKKQAQQEKFPQFNRRVANEGEDPKKWQNFKHFYQKKADGEGSDQEEEEEASGDEENESDEDNVAGKKKIIPIPIQFNSRPVEFMRGGPRRGSGRFRDRPYQEDRPHREDRPYKEDRPYRDNQQRSMLPNEQQRQSFQQAGEYQNDEQPARPYRGSRQQGSSRGEYRRTYRYSTRGSYNRSNTDSNTPDFANALDFPTLPKQ